mmetsp:Transcript_102320/g.318728  ORF Transcript_102320/g.318728 Transcript_102320/m.318728 type:complete len:594 (+) Transcript_102320:58-1839(+)
MAYASAVALLVPLLLSTRAQGWRSECEIEGLEVEVSMHGVGASDDSQVRKCHVAFLTHEDIQSRTLDLSGADIIFTDTMTYVPFAGRTGPIHFLENISNLYFPPDLDAVMEQKTELLSILLPPQEAWSDLAQAIFDQARTMLPDHVYIDDGSLETHAAAFTRYRFCLIADDGGNRSISLPFIRSLGFHTIAVYNGFVEIGAMVFNGIADFLSEPFSLPDTILTINKHNEQLGALWHYQRIIQDQVRYRYNRPFEERLFSQACSLCRLRADPLGATPPLAFVGIYSARANFEKRQAVRSTWGRVLSDVYGLRYRFFLGEASPGAAADEMRVRRELEEHNDIVFLEAAEGYRMNSRKGLLFLEWIALRGEAEFLLKVDDDVYFRPVHLLEQLRHRPPVQYAWGIFDYISPVPREEGNDFYNTEEDFPFDVFPPYPRGVVRVLSMDVVRLLARASREGRLRMIYGDDPCLGVHLRQLLHDPVEPLPSLTLDDFDNRVFAMEPSCHPNLWSKITNRTWAVHHVTPDHINCMWLADLRAGYYVETREGAVQPGEDFTVDALPDLCSCAPDPSFENRTDLDNLQEETNRILFDSDEPPR